MMMNDDDVDDDNVMMMELQTSSKCGDDEQTPLPLHYTTHFYASLFKASLAQ